MQLSSTKAPLFLARDMGHAKFSGADNRHPRRLARWRLDAGSARPLTCVMLYGYVAEASDTVRSGRRDRWRREDGAMLIQTAM